jgi:hypothetical protein
MRYVSVPMIKKGTLQCRMVKRCYPFVSKESLSIAHSNIMAMHIIKWGSTVVCNKLERGEVGRKVAPIKIMETNEFGRQRKDCISLLLRSTFTHTHTQEPGKVHRDWRSPVALNLCFTWWWHIKYMRNVRRGILSSCCGKRERERKEMLFLWDITCMQYHLPPK